MLIFLDRVLGVRSLREVGFGRTTLCGDCEKRAEAIGLVEDSKRVGSVKDALSRQ